MTRLLAALLLAAAQFQPALPGYNFSFPRDHGTHDEYQTEWWYYTGHLRAGEKSYGFELTFFRVGISREPAVTRWDLRDLSLAHFAITDVDGRQFRYYEKLNRSSPFTASAAAGGLDVFNESWRAAALPDGAWRIAAQSGGDAIDLVLRSRKPPAIHGENGVIAKGKDASHYYSMTRLDASGTVNGRRCTGQAWMDHEFGSTQLRESRIGWDWFSVQLDDGTELMLYAVRGDDATSSGSLIAADGKVIHLRREQIRIEPLGRWRSPKSGAVYPMGWRVLVPQFGIAVTLQPVLEDQELVTKQSTQVTYWEGAVRVSGSAGGEGYVEMTGYSAPFRR